MEGSGESDSSNTYDSAEEESFMNGKDITLYLSDSDSGEGWVSSSQTKRRCGSTGSEVPTSLSTQSSQQPSTKVSAPTVPTATPKTRFKRKTISSGPVPLKAQRLSTKTSPPSEEDKWHDVTDEDKEPKLPPFKPKRRPGPQLSQVMVYSPLQLFKLFFSPSVVNTIVVNTNKYANKRKKAGKEIKWTRLTVNEFYSYIALITHTALVKLKSLSDYWSQKPGYRFDFPCSVMSRERFFAISWNLRLSDPDVDAANMGNKGSLDYDRLFKIKPLYNDILTACRTHFHPRRELSVNERVVASKAQSVLKPYVKNTPARWGYKLFVLADSSNGYTSNFFVYEEGKSPVGKERSYDFVMELLDFSFLGRGYRVYMDHFYTSPTLFRDLVGERTLACGPISTNQPDYPRTAANDLPRDAEKGAIRWHRRGQLLFVKWKDAREVNLCSTIHRAYAGHEVCRSVKTDQGAWKKEPIPIPAAAKDYNKYKGGIDQSDLLMGCYQVLYKTKKWYKRFFFHFIDIAIVNSFLLHKELAKLRKVGSLSQKRFRETLQLELVNMKNPAEEAVPVPTPMCLPAFFSSHAMGQRRVCEMCKRASKTMKTAVYCIRCDVPLCQVPARNCFKAWHEEGHHQQFGNHV